jgi:SAM-dependent methyltransferase
VNEAMSAEFGTVAEWTAQAAVEMGREYYLPAACRGSGNPRGLDWLIDRLDLAAGQTMLDCGAGVGGPAAYAAQQRSVRPILLEPEAPACRAARTLFDHPVVRAVGSRVPMRDESCDVAWALGVLCTMREQLQLLTELRRVIRSGGRIGLLVFVLRSAAGELPQGNHFPTPESLTDLLARAGLRIDGWLATSDLPPIPADWQRREEEVTARLQERHGEKKAWRLAEHQSDIMGRLLGESVVTGELLTLRRH